MFSVSVIYFVNSFEWRGDCVSKNFTYIPVQIITKYFILGGEFYFSHHSFLPLMWSGPTWFFSFSNMPGFWPYLSYLDISLTTRRYPAFITRWLNYIISSLMDTKTYFKLYIIVLKCVFFSNSAFINLWNFPLLKNCDVIHWYIYKLISYFSFILLFNRHLLNELLWSRSSVRQWDYFLKWIRHCLCFKRFQCF